MARLPPGVRYRSVQIDHPLAEVTLRAMAHLPRLDVEVPHLDPELVQRPRGQPDQHLLAVALVAFLRRVREHPVLPLFTVSRRPERDAAGEFIWDVVPLVIRELGILTHPETALSKSVVADSSSRPC